MKFSCVIVDEDAGVRKSFEAYFDKHKGIELVGCFNSISDGCDFLRTNTTDILIADIEMQQFISMQYDDFKQPPPSLVFTTTDASNAFIGFDMDAIDCLVKPFSYERFLKSVDKIERRLRLITSNDMPAVVAPESRYFFVKTDHNFIKVEFSKIWYVEGLENYVRICCENKTVLALSTLKNIEAALMPYRFLRIHRSYLVNLDKVDSVLNYNFHVGEKVLPVGKSYRRTVSDVLKYSYNFLC